MNTKYSVSTAILGAAFLAPMLIGLPAAEATHGGWHSKTCWKTQYGVTVKIKMRDNTEFTRVRISHPRGTGSFLNPNVSVVRGSVEFYSITPAGPDGTQVGGGSINKSHRFGPSFRISTVQDGYSYTAVHARFKLVNGKVIGLSCDMP